MGKSQSIVFKIVSIPKIIKESDDDLPASDELTPRRGTDGLNVIILQLHSVCSEFIQHRCPDVRAVVPDVVEPLVICHDEDYMRRLRDGKPVVKSPFSLIFLLVGAHQIPGQVAEAEQAHHGKTSQSCRCHCCYDDESLKPANISYIVSTSFCRYKTIPSSNSWLTSAGVKQSETYKKELHLHPLRRS